MPFQRLVPHNDLNKDELLALAYHRPQVCAMEDHPHHHEHSICAVCDQLLRCNPLVCVVGDHVFLASKKEQTPLGPTQQQLVVIATGEPGFSSTVDVCQLCRTRAVCDARGRSTAPYCE